MGSEVRNSTCDESDVSKDFDACEYARRVGARLREIRRQQGLSLHDVEARSSKEFKASVLGAYERGERSISVPRLSRLAEFYSVAVDQLLPTEESVSHTDQTPRSSADSIAIDLRALRGRHSPETEVLERYLTRIQLERQDFNGRVLTVRREDLRTIGHLLDLDFDAFTRRLSDLGLLAEISS